MTHPENQFFDFYRASLKVAGDAARASLEGAVRLRKKQLACIDEALATHAQVLDEVSAAKDIGELMIANRKLASAHYQTLISHWSGLCEAVGENQTEITRLVQSQMEQVRDDFQSKLGAIPEVPAPMLAALQPLMEVASSAYVLTARATAEAAKLAAAQLAGASAVASTAATKPAKQAQQRRQSA